jgi:NADPH-dependent 7-cyano-7-deazaguanine reductase QueF
LVEDLAPHSLTVTGYYQRRGGIDITPHRSTQPVSPPIFRMGRQ